MLEFDEASLIEFFDVHPQPQPPSEKAYYEASFFVKTVDGITLKYSVSANFSDLYCELFIEGQARPIYSCVAKELISIRVEKDPTGRPWLRACSNNAEIAVSVDPSISITAATE